MNAADLKAFYDRAPETVQADPGLAKAHHALLAALETGLLRAAEPDGQGGWTANVWVKQAILAGFRATKVESMDGPG